MDAGHVGAWRHMKLGAIVPWIFLSESRCYNIRIRGGQADAPLPHVADRLMSRHPGRGIMPLPSR